MSTDDILAQIDDSIDDWSVSMDAMRSNAPEEKRSPLGRLGRPVHVDIDEVTARASDQLTVELRVAVAMRGFAAQMGRAAVAAAALTAAMPPELDDE